MANEIPSVKCKVTHAGKSNKALVTIDSELTVIIQEIDIGGVINRSIKTSAQYSASSQKANQMLEIIRK